MSVASGSEDDRDLPGFVVPNEEVEHGSLLDVDEPEAEMSDSSSSDEEVPEQTAKGRKKGSFSGPKLKKAKSVKDVGSLDALLTRVKQIAAQENPHTLTEQPSGLTNVKMHDYQLYGLNWLISLWNNNINGILGDEMGLGKTLQAISMMLWLHDVQKLPGPYLVVIPLTVLGNWVDELKRFAPALKVIPYMGEPAAREQLRTHIVDFINAQPKEQRKKDPKLNFNVFLTSYDFAIKDAEFLQKFDWKYLVVDEAHRLKNHESLLYTTLLSWKAPHKLLLTGTPLQNNIAELWALLHFLMPSLFNDLDSFKVWFKGVDWDALKSAEGTKGRVADMHALLRPFLLRRMKADVALSLPTKKEILLSVGMSVMQKQYYRMVLEKDAEKLNAVTKNKTSLLNIVMQLRKCCNHPYLFDGAEPLFDGEYKLGPHLLNDSGKLFLLDKLLAKLHKEGHKVLLFSQMTRMLDILQDYLHYRGFAYERLDGSVRGEERYIAVQKFNQESDTFVFLLSTRAGGQGLNLVSADTVIFYDSDWNPQRDLQAEARAHRLGQKRDVTVYRLITASTVEELILRRAIRKLRLTHAVIEQGGFSLATQDAEEAANPNAIGKEELLSAVKYGLSKITANANSSISDEDIDTIIRKAEQLQLEGKADDKDAKKKPKSKKDGEDEIQVVGEEEAAEAEEEEKGLYDYVPEMQAEDEAVLLKLVEASAQRKQQLAAAGIVEGDDTLLLRGGGKRKTGPTLSKEELAARREEQAAIRAAKRDERRAEKWRKNGYASLSLEEEADGGAGSPGASPKASPSLPSAATAEDDIISEADMSAADSSADIIYLGGDVTQPQPTAKDAAQPIIIVHCVDDSGSWGNGGVFKALDTLSPAPRNAYTAAGNNDDLSLGQTHLVPIPNTKPPLYVALVVAQHRDKKGAISGIRNDFLATAFSKIAAAAVHMKASVHLPRIGAGTPGFNWYTNERQLRHHLVGRSVPTYVYYFQRRGPRSSQSFKGSPGFTQQSQGSVVMKSAHGQQQQAKPSLKRAPTEDMSLPTVSPSAKVARPSKPPQASSPSASPSASLAHTQSSASPASVLRGAPELPSTFRGVQALLFEVGDELGFMKRHLIAHDGDLVTDVREATHIVTALAKQSDPLKELVERNPHVKVVSTRWVRESIAKGSALPDADYAVSF